MAQLFYIHAFDSDQPVVGYSSLPLSQCMVILKRAGPCILVPAGYLCSSLQKEILYSALVELGRQNCLASELIYRNVADSYEDCKNFAAVQFHCQSVNFANSDSELARD